jgi:FMN phosphatase YigB (HAD superfamily)
LSVTRGDNTPNTVTTVAWIATGIIGFITTVYTFKNNREVPQREWYINRRRAESMRSHYYQYLAQVPPYHGSNENREIRLLQTLVQVSSLGKRRQGAQAAPPADDIAVSSRGRSSLSQAEAQFLREVYLDKRLRFQEDWYKNRMGEFRQNSGFTHMAAALLMGLSTLIAGSNVVTSEETAPLLLSLLPLLAVLLPSAAAMFASFQQMYSWERQLTLYDETLEQLKAAQIPLIVSSDRPITVRRLTDAIAACEAVFATESDQWGQDVLNSNVPDRDKVLQEMFDAQLERLGLSDEAKKSVYSIIDSSQTQTQQEPAPPGD